jgi:hypothetical protein
MIGFINTLYIHAVRDYMQFSAIAILHTFQVTVAYALGFSVFTSHILATDLSQYHCHFNSHLKCSWHSLIPFCHFFSITFYCHLQNSTKFSRILFCTPSTVTSTVPQNTSYNYFARTLRKTPSYIVQNVCLLVCYIAMDVLLLSACVAGMCLQNRCLAMVIHVTIFKNVSEEPAAFIFKIYQTTGVASKKTVIFTLKQYSLTLRL